MRSTALLLFVLGVLPVFYGIGHNASIDVEFCGCREQLDL